MELTKDIIEKLKKNSIDVYEYHSYQTSRLELSVREDYFNSKNEKITKTKKYKTDLYGKHYSLIQSSIDGVIYMKGKIYPLHIEEDDYYGDSLGRMNIDGYVFDKEEALKKLKEDNLKSYLVGDANNKTIYELNPFFNQNNKENILKYIEELNDNGYNLRIIKEPIKEWLNGT